MNGALCNILLLRTLWISFLLCSAAWARVEVEDAYCYPFFSPDLKQVAYERHFLSNLGRVAQVWSSDLKGRKSRMLCEYPEVFGDYRDQHLLGWTPRGEVLVRDGRPADRTSQSSDCLWLYPSTGVPVCWARGRLQGCTLYARSGSLILVGSELSPSQPEGRSNGYLAEVPGRMAVLDLEGRTKVEIHWPYAAVPRCDLSPDGHWILDFGQEAVHALSTHGGGEFHCKGSWDLWCWVGQHVLLRQPDGYALDWDISSGKPLPLQPSRGDFTYLHPYPAYVQGQTVVAGPLGGTPRQLRHFERGTPRALAWLPSLNQLLFTVAFVNDPNQQHSPREDLYLNEYCLSRAHRRQARYTRPLPAGLGLQPSDRHPGLSLPLLEKELELVFNTRYGEECFYSGARLVYFKDVPLALAVGPTGMGSARIWAAFQRRASGWECLGERMILGEEAIPPEGVDLELLGLDRLPSNLLRQLTGSEAMQIEDAQRLHPTPP